MIDAELSAIAARYGAIITRKTKITYLAPQRRRKWNTHSVYGWKPKSNGVCYV